MQASAVFVDAIIAPRRPVDPVLQQTIRRVADRLAFSGELFALRHGQPAVHFALSRDTVVDGDGGRHLDLLFRLANIAMAQANGYPIPKALINPKK